jgi:hypothetical protein
VHEGHQIRAAHPQPSPSRSHLAAGGEQREEQEYVGAIRDRSSMRGGQRGKSQLFVQGKIEGHQYDMMLDTGASHNVLCLNRLPLRLQQLLWERAQPSPRTITGAGGQETPTAGETYAMVEIGGTTSRIEAVILDDCPYGVIIGMPALRELGASLDLGTGTATTRSSGALTDIGDANARRRGPGRPRSPRRRGKNT